MKFRAKLHAFFTSLAVAAAICAPMAFAAPASAALFDNAKNNACSGINVGAGNQCSAAAGTKLTTTINRIINLISVIVGIAAVIMIMIAGFKYVTANGDANSISNAKNTLIYAMVGLVVVAFSQIFVKFILYRVIHG